MKRTWLIYSKTKNALYCFCCKLFSTKEQKLVTEGLTDWKNVGTLLKSHESKAVQHT